LSYDIRRKVYLSSKIAFGFHHDNNILNSHVTQRVFEALCYGCVVLSDNSAATDITDGIVVYVKDKRDFIEKYIYYLSNPEECEKKRIAGYEWAKKFGTNRYAAKLFLDVKIKTSTT
jgi:spore maturation protein CgeB